ncbi:hypothetical protein L226DRAFT_536262 [Lentinus tigrinus ALCF2SS1-7]|uniref:uncharacterized protein n=1 Tax=Lentinus tigrinus ALCF2SS1-7 TaxID=1328758 RepID=UPI001165E15D|nr:hypothetical protein L226DRAFT_536262 [Lentinus tigrinus ALCF2SS1-7]
MHHSSNSTASKVWPETTLILINIYAICALDICDIVLVRVLRHSLDLVKYFRWPPLDCIFTPGASVCA